MMKHTQNPDIHAKPLSRADMITLIIEHMVNQGIEHPDQFAEFLEDLLCYGDELLYTTLEELEALAP